MSDWYTGFVTYCNIQGVCLRLDIYQNKEVFASEQDFGGVTGHRHPIFRFGEGFGFMCVPTYLFAFSRSFPTPARLRNSNKEKIHPMAIAASRNASIRSVGLPSNAWSSISKIGR